MTAGLREFDESNVFRHLGMFWRHPAPDAGNPLEPPPERPGGGGGGKRGRRGGKSLPSHRSDSKAHPHDLPLWEDDELDRRQRAALPDYDHDNADPLDQHEIEFVERMKAKQADQIVRLVWLPRAEPDDQGHRAATSDFVWERPDGVVQMTELKSTSTNPRRIGLRISDAVRDARPVVKENFIIDLGPAELSPSLAHKLANYNFNRAQQAKPGDRPALIKRLWVLSEDGDELVEIDLR